MGHNVSAYLPVMGNYGFKSYVQAVSPLFLRLVSKSQVINVDY